MLLRVGIAMLLFAVALATVVAVVVNLSGRGEPWHRAVWSEETTVAPPRGDGEVRSCRSLRRLAASSREDCRTTQAPATMRPSRTRP